MASLIYLVETVSFSSFTQIKTEWFFELKVFLFYQLIGIIAALLGAGIISPKVKKYQAFYDSGDRLYSLQTLKIQAVAVSFLLLFVMRAVVAKPALFVNTINTPNSFLGDGFAFLITGFSPLYFSVLIFGFLLFFIYRISELITSAVNYLKIVKFLFAALVSFAFLFSYEALHAEKIQANKNLFFFGFNKKAVTNLEKSQPENPTPLLDSLTHHSYKCDNYFSSAAEPFSQFAAIISGLSPLSTGIASQALMMNSQDFSPHLWQKLASSGYKVIAVVPNEFSSLIDKSDNSQISIITPPKTENSSSASVLRHPLLLGFVNHRFLITHIFPEYSHLPQSQLSDYLTDCISSKIDKNQPLALFYFSNPLFSELPYPYHRMPENSALQLFAEHTVSGILQQFSAKSKNSLVVLNSLPDREISLETGDLKQLLYCFDSQDLRKKGVKSYFSGADLGAVILDLLALDTLNYPGEKRNFANAANLTEDILVTEAYSKFAARKNLIKTPARLSQEEKKALYQYYTTYAYKTLIAGRKQFDYQPQDSGVVTRLTYFENEAAENSQLKIYSYNLLKMSSIFEDLHKRSAFQPINGYFLK